MAIVLSIKSMASISSTLVYTGVITFLPKLFFPEGIGVYIKLVEIPSGNGQGGRGGGVCIQNMEIPGKRRH